MEGLAVLWHVYYIYNNTGIIRTPRFWWEGSSETFSYGRAGVVFSMLFEDTWSRWHISKSDGVPLVVLLGPMLFHRRPIANGFGGVRSPHKLFNKGVGSFRNRCCFFLLFHIKRMNFECQTCVLIWRCVENNGGGSQSDKFVLGFWLSDRFSLGSVFIVSVVFWRALWTYLYDDGRRSCSRRERRLDSLLWMWFVTICYLRNC